MKKNTISQTTVSILLAILAAFSYSLMALSVKLTSDQTTEAMGVFFRFVISTSWILAFTIYKKTTGAEIVLKTKNLKINILRSMFTCLSVLAFFYSIRHTSLVNANSLMMTYVPLVPLFSFFVWHKKTNVKTWLALFIGFMGVIFILKPQSAGINFKALAALIASLSITLSYLAIGFYKKEPAHTIMLYYFPMALILSSVLVAFNWQTPNSTDTMLLIAAGIAGTIYQEAITRAMIYTTPSTVSPILYLIVLFSGLFDQLFWNNRVIDRYFALGTALIIVGCCVAVYHNSKDCPASLKS